MSDLIEPTVSLNELNPPEGQLLLVNKPLEWTSFDVVNKLRNSIRKGFNLKKIKVGHAGTLDPLASGLLLICTGPFTKKLNELTGMEKTYTGSFTLGHTTPSFDLETEPDETFETDHITEEQIHAVAEQMTGEQDQVPPAFSAKKVDGKRAYKSARKGETVELAANTINILDFKITAIEMPRVDFEITCSKGTYIRSIARDFGVKLNSGAYLSALKRTAVGPYSSADAFELDELSQHLLSAKDTL